MQLIENHQASSTFQETPLLQIAEAPPEQPEF